MRGKKYLWTLFILMFLASMANVSIPVTSSPTVTFRVEPSITAGVPVGSPVAVNVSIEAPQGTAVIAWGIAIKVDPDVLKPGYTTDGWEFVAYTGVAGYFLYDWCVANGWDPEPPNPTSLMVGVKDEAAGVINGTVESIKAWADLGVGVGADGTGTLVTFFFTSLNETAWSSIVITEAYYWTSLESPDEDKHPPDIIINGHYNTPEHDVAVTAISAPPNATVGDSVPINVSVWNLGANNETFNLEVSANTTLIENRSVSLASDASGMESFTWNTTGVDPGNYTITARAILATDLDPSNDERTTTFLLLLHDVAVTDVTATSFEVNLGEPVTINVTVTNEGGFPETVNVTVSYDTTIDTKIVTLDVGESKTEQFTWDTTGVPLGIYPIMVEASVAEDDDPTDNTITTEWGIKIVPEFPTLIPLLLALAVLAVSTIVLKRRQRKPSTSGSPTAQP